MDAAAALLTNEHITRIASVEELEQFALSRPGVAKVWSGWVWGGQGVGWMGLGWPRCGMAGCGVVKVWGGRVWCAWVWSSQDMWWPGVDWWVWPRCGLVGVAKVWIGGCGQVWIDGCGKVWIGGCGQGVDACWGEPRPSPAARQPCQHTSLRLFNGLVVGM